MWKYFTVAVILALSGCTPKKDSNIIRIVGSSTAYPYIITVAEDFHRNNKSYNPVVEPTGTGMGFKLFCGEDQKISPNIVVASRKIKPSEIAKCKKHGVEELYEATFGYDGIVIAASKESALSELSREDLFTALSDIRIVANKVSDNDMFYWNKINSKLPDEPIIIYGPNPSSGTREEINNLIMNYVCKKYPNIGKIYKKNNLFCSEIRRDKAYVDVGKNENLIITKITQIGQAIGITGYNYFVQNQDSVKALKIDGVSPNKENLLSMKYSLSRPLLIYYKKSSSDEINIRTRKFLERLFSQFMIGYDGYLQTKGMIPISNEQIKKNRSRINEAFTNN